jgi:hypothetical protein
MLQVFCIGVAKVKRDVAHACCNGYARMFQVYICYKCFICIRCMLQVDLDVAYKCMLRAYVSSVSDVSYVCCKCFIWILHMFAMVFKYFSDIFASVSDACFKCFV